jgi:hypothetical protein
LCHLTYEEYGMAGPPKTIVYQAQITLASTLDRIQAARSIIELAGGKVEVFPANTPGLTIVRLTLPESVPPDAVLPSVPFFPL